MRWRLLTAAAICVLAAAAAGAETLRAPDEFAGIRDHGARSRALFTEAGKVITSPRCLNCHPAGDHPLQDDDSHAHFPIVLRGPSDIGVAGAHCGDCHQDHNVEVTAQAPSAAFKSIPGHPRWALAPREMAWQGKSLGEICAQLKDPARNGGRTLAELQHHFAQDELVGWGWQPGRGRKPAPGTQAELGALIQAWIDTGAACP